jgi:biopolymer transport protein ExbD
MAFSSNSSGGGPMADINVTPLVDVMLVLLIVFIITVPVMQHSVKVDLPRATSTPQDAKPETIRLSVDAQGQYFWNEQPLADAELEPRLRQAAAREPQPELHLRGDKNARYERVAQALAAAQRTGMRKIGFITEPKAPGA